MTSDDYAKEIDDMVDWCRPIAARLAQSFHEQAYIVLSDDYRFDILFKDELDESDIILETVLPRP